MTENVIEIRVKVDGDRARREMRDVETHGNRLGTKLGGIGKMGALAALGGITAGVAGVGFAMVQGVKDAAAYQTLQAATAAVLKSTGNVAGTSVKHVDALAASLESLSGVDETLIINSQNVLATFTNIRNTKAHQTFDDATKAALNLSSAMHEDLQSASVQVGKALNDPIKGLTALSRVGVTFDAEQKKLITGYMKHGEVAKAQAVILKELNKEFGGAAKAAGSGFAGSLARAKDAAMDAMRSIGMALLPTLTNVANWIATKGIPALITFAHWVGPKLKEGFDRARTAIVPLVQWFRDSFLPALERAYRQIFPAVQSALKTVTDAFHNNQDGVQKAGNIMRAIGLIITQALIPALSVVARVYIPMVAREWAIAIMVINKVVLPAIRFLVSFWLTAVGTIVHAAAVAFGWIPGIGPKLRAADKAFQTFRDGVNRALAGIKDQSVNFTVRLNGGQAPALTAQQLLSGKFMARGVTVKGSGRRTGGIVGYAAGGGPRSNSVLVGEDGPEIVDLPPGSMVHTNADSQGMGGGGGDRHIYLHIDSAGSRLDDLLVEVLRKAIRDRGGGNVQLVLGR